MTTLRALTSVLMLVLAACGGGGGGFASDGGVSGTGISAVTGNVAAITGDDGVVAGISVTIAGTDLVAETDAGGFFSVSGEFDGPVTLVFARPADGLSVQVDVQVPAGGNLELADIVLDGASGEARPERREVSFRGRIDAVDCPGDRLFVVSRFESARLVFTIRLDRMILRGTADRPIGCDDLRAGMDVVVTGIVQDDESIADGEVEVTSATEPTPTRTRAGATPTRAASPRPDPTAPDDPGPVRPTPEPTPTEVPGRPSASPSPTEPLSRPTATTTREPLRPTATPTREPRPTPTRVRSRGGLS